MSGAVRVIVGYRGFRRLIMVSATDSFEIKHRLETFEHLQQRAGASTLCECFQEGYKDSSFTTKSCACATIAFQLGIISWYVDSTRAKRRNKFGYIPKSRITEGQFFIFYLFIPPPPVSGYRLIVKCGTFLNPRY